MLEIESLGPLGKVGAAGGVAEHVEQWYLFKADVGETESQIEAAITPLLEQTSPGTAGANATEKKPR